MEIGGVVIDDTIMDCFNTLGITPTNNLCVIKGAYRSMVRLVHPDKIKSSGIGWSKEECQKAFDNLKKSYDYLITQFKYTDVPDYDIVYLQDEFNESLNETDFDISAFNRMFEQQKKPDYGYDEFSGGSYTEASDLKKVTSCNSKESKKVSHNIISLLPDNVENDSNYALLGQDRVETVENGNKTKLCGSDLDLVYGNNYETWEETHNRSFSKTNKYSLEQQFENMMLEREKKIELTKEEREKISVKERVELELDKKRKKRYNQTFLN